MAEALTSIVTCPQCGAKNRVNERVAGDRQPVCGKCGAKLPAAGADAGSDAGADAGAASSSTPSHPIEVTDANFEQVLAGAGDKPILVDCWAAWCPPCRALAPTMDKLAAESNGRWVIGKLDTMANPVITARFDTSRIPIMYIFKRGKLVDQLLGAQPKAVIEATLQKHL
jgi:thioredoxin